MNGSPTLREDSPELDTQYGDTIYRMAHALEACPGLIAYLLDGLTAETLAFVLTGVADWQASHPG